MSPAELAAELIMDAIKAALDAKKTKDELLDAVRASLLAASDAEMHRELDGTDGVS